MKPKFTTKKIPKKKLTEISLGALFAVLTMMMPVMASAQYPVSSYTFSQSSGTYTPITGGTVIASSIPDYQAYPSITLSPGFNFCGVVYTNAFVTADGLITLGGTTAANTTNGIAYGGGSGVLLCPFNADMVGSSASGANPNIRYQLVGDEHVFQWNDISRWPAATDRFSFQARLNTVTGTITYVYSVTSVGTSTSYQPVIGIRTDNTAGNWQSRLVANNATSSWAASAAATNTTDVLRFTSSATNPKQPATGQTYVYTPPPACNTSTSLPTAGTVTASPGNICMSGNVTLNFTPATAMPSVTGITYKWQTATAAAGPYTDIPGAITTAPTYTTTTPVTANAYFRCVVLCNGSTTVLTSSASSQVVINNPGTPTVTGATRCGPGSLNLSATPPSGSTINWYANPTGGAPLATATNTFNTGYIPATTTFYAAAASGSSPAQQWVGTGTSVTTDYRMPYYDYYYGNKTQYLIRASEMQAVGLGAGTINSLSFDVTSIASPWTFTSFVIKIKSTSLTALTSGITNFETGLTTCYTAATYSAVANSVNTHTLSTPFIWDGSSNIIIEVCHNNNAYNTNGASTNVKYSTYSYNTTHYAYADDPNQCTTIYQYSSDGVSTSRPNIRFDMTLGCTGARLPVTATITAPPAVTKTAPDIACNNAAVPISVTSSPMSNYTTYAWTPNVTDLYTNATASTPYVSGNAPTVYMKSNTVGMHTYYMFASGATAAACTYADTVNIWVQPESVAIQAFPDTLCAPSGSTTLKLVPATGYAPNSIQWQESTDGINYTNIASANGVTYTTPMLSANRYYKAVIKSGGATPCLEPTKLIVVANPSLVSWSDSFNCGPGTVTLNAVAAGSGNVRWYDSPTASIPVGGGSPWTTPYIGATTTYYVESGTGSIQPPPTFIGSGTSTNWWGYLPYFATYYTASKAQWLITAAEMQAAGFAAGLITDIGFEVTTKSGTTTIANLTYSMKAISGSTMGATFHTGMQQVYTTTGYNPTANAVNNHTLQSPFYWDGVSSIILEECSTNPSNQYGYVNVKYNSGSTLYYYTSSTSATGTNCSAPTGLYTSTTRPNIRLTLLGGCRSAREAVTAFIRPVPVVDLGNDINECVDAGAVEVLDAGVQPNNATYLWDNGSTSQVRAVSTSGSYSVSVTNQYTCEKSDTINVTLRKNPVVELGNDTTVCNGVVLPLNAGNDGIDYFWNTGETSQEIDVNSPGVYNVFVTNSLGCTKTDTITVNMSGELPTISGINISNNGQNTFNFTAVNPQNVIGYDWDFGDGSPHSYQAAPSHTYANSGNYIVVLKLSSSCGFYDDSTSAHIVGIHQLNLDNSELMVYPNPSRELVTIENHSGLKMERIELYNVLGQVVYRADADSKDKHVLRLSGIASGLYTIQVYTDKGTVARKLEIMK